MHAPCGTGQADRGKAMLSHATVGARDLARMGTFYGAVLAPLGLARRWEGLDDGGPPGIGWAAPGTRVPTFFVQEPFDRRPASAGNGCLVASLAHSPKAVREAHAAGGSDEGAPGERPQHRRGHFGSCFRDPEGNKLHAVHRGDLAAG